MGAEHLSCNDCINFNSDEKKCKRGHGVGNKSSLEQELFYSWETIIEMQEECLDWNDGSKEEVSKALERELEETRKAIIQDVNRFLGNVDDKKILDEFSIFIDTIDECLRLQEPKEFEALKRLFDSIVEKIGG